jgi:hypothetical protein
VHVDAHVFFVTSFGLLALLVAWLPLYLNRLPLSLAMACLAAGFALIALPALPPLEPLRSVDAA